MTLQELERQKSEKQKEIETLLHANSASEKDCEALQDQLTRLNNLEQVLPISKELDLHSRRSDLHACLYAPEGGLSCFGCWADMYQAGIVKGSSPIRLPEIVGYAIDTFGKSFSVLVFSQHLSA